MYSCTTQQLGECSIWNNEAHEMSWWIVCPFVQSLVCRFGLFTLAAARARALRPWCPVWQYATDGTVHHTALWQRPLVDQTQLQENQQSCEKRLQASMTKAVSTSVSSVPWMNKIATSHGDKPKPVCVKLISGSWKWEDILAQGLSRKTGAQYLWRLEFRPFMLKAMSPHGLCICYLLTLPRLHNLSIAANAVEETQAETFPTHGVLTQLACAPVYNTDRRTTPHST